MRLTRGKLTITSFPVACYRRAWPDGHSPASDCLCDLGHASSLPVLGPPPASLSHRGTARAWPFLLVCALVTRHKTPGAAKGPGVVKPLPRGCSRRSQLKVVLTLPAQSRAPAAGLSGPKPHTCTPHPLPSPKSSLTSVPPSEALFSSLPQPRSSTMLFLLLHFLISSQFAPTQLPPPEIPKVSESEVTQSCLTLRNPHGL